MSPHRKLAGSQLAEQREVSVKAASNDSASGNFRLQGCGTHNSNKGVLLTYQEDIVEDLPHNVAVCFSIEHHAGILFQEGQLSSLCNY